MYTVVETFRNYSRRPHTRSFDKEIVMIAQPNGQSTLLTWPLETQAQKFAAHLAECRVRQGIESTIQIQKL